MKKIILGLSVFMMTLMSAQNFPDYYPNNGYGNNNYYGDADDEFYFPDDYYYQYPTDYYSNDLYRNYYNDYRSSINNINWNRFFTMNRLSPWQMQQIIMLNDSYSSYSSWNSVYRYNPDRWYYDRFYALQHILGPRLFVVFQNNFYNGYNPVNYYQSYNQRHYARNVYVVPRYRYVNVNVYRVNRASYHQSNPRANIGFQQKGRSGQTQNGSSFRDNGFRNSTGGSATSSRNNTFRNDNNVTGSTARTTAPSNQRNNTFRNEPTSPSTNTQEIKRSQSDQINRNSTPARQIENVKDAEINTNGRNSSLRNSGLRLTTR